MNIFIHQVLAALHCGPGRQCWEEQQHNLNSGQCSSQKHKQNACFISCTEMQARILPCERKSQHGAVLFIDTQYHTLRKDRTCYEYCMCMSTTCFMRVCIKYNFTKTRSGICKACLSKSFGDTVYLINKNNSN